MDPSTLRLAFKDQDLDQPHLISVHSSLQDKHHTFMALQLSSLPTNLKFVYLDIQDNLSSMTQAAFWKYMVDSKLVSERARV